MEEHQDLWSIQTVAMLSRLLALSLTLFPSYSCSYVVAAALYAGLESFPFTQAGNFRSRRKPHGLGGLAWAASSSSIARVVDELAMKLRAGAATTRIRRKRRSRQCCVAVAHAACKRTRLD